MSSPSAQAAEEHLAVSRLERREVEEALVESVPKDSSRHQF